MDESKIQKLCEHLWPSSRLDDSQKVTIQQLGGGTFNEVAAVTVHNRNGMIQALVLRIPRMPWYSSVDREAATLHYVHQSSSIPVPEVITFDSTSDNPLEQPYMVQSRIPGRNLQRYHPHLSHESNCSIAREVAKTILAMQSIQSPIPGIIESVAGSTNKFTISSFDLRENGDQDWKSRPQDYKNWAPDLKKSLYGTTVNFLITQFGRWKAKRLLDNPLSISHRDYEQEIVTVAQAMNKLGLFFDDTNCLCHLDFFPRNIMIKASDTTNTSMTISGVLDWDSAIFAPNFISCAPPWWVWTIHAEDAPAHWNEADETIALALPRTAEGRELKRIFEETVGAEFLHYAYKPQYRLARKLFHFAVNGLQRSRDFEEADALLEEWEVVRHELMDRQIDGLVAQLGGLRWKTGAR